MAGKSMVATKEMAFFCFQVLENSFLKKKTVAPKNFPKDPVWKKARYLSLDNNELRGCKGSLGTPKSLPFMLEYFSINAAFEDSRFPPISKSELPELVSEISILNCFEPISDIFDWTVGVHGINIEFTVRASVSSSKIVFEGGAVFLPSVAQQQGWDRKTTINHLIRKAGYRGKLDYSLMSFEATRHQSSSERASYGEYVNWKKQLGLQDI